MPTPKLGIADSVLEAIKKTILEYKPVEKIVVYGSRGRGLYRKTSDIDIAIFAPDWSDTDVNLVKDQLEERVRTPLKMELVNFYSISKPSLKNNILKQGNVIYER